MLSGYQFPAKETPMARHRVLRSTVQAADIPDDQQEAYLQAIAGGTTVRCTYDLDDGLVVYRVAVTGYTDPGGQHRWALTYCDQAAVDNIDYPADQLDQVLADYEQMVRAGADAIASVDDARDPVFTATDVDDVTAAVKESPAQGNIAARHLAVQWATKAMEDTAVALSKAIDYRRVTCALAAGAVTAGGAGGVSAVARTLNVSQPTASLIVRAGEGLLVSPTGTTVGAGIRYAYTYQVETQWDDADDWEVVVGETACWDASPWPQGVAAAIATGPNLVDPATPRWRVVVWRGHPGEHLPDPDAQHEVRGDGSCTAAGCPGCHAEPCNTCDGRGCPECQP